MSNLYKVGERDLIELGKAYGDHVYHMTHEGLHSKSDIAAELAYRDNEIQRLTREKEELLSCIDNGRKLYLHMLNYLKEHNLLTDMIREKADEWQSIFED